MQDQIFDHLRKSVFGKIMMSGGVNRWFCHSKCIQELKEEGETHK